ncbi:MAG: AmmeMemoRadiSam system radical SAM enzyme [Nitrospinae bacterium]|jgi:pyruvate formate lyase activating enzyme|nr:AmmeMemoRadiSam system radical SAM enzyme [Nitrospinota bacterium]
MATKTVQNELDRSTRPGELVQKLPGGVLICTACGHLCKLRPGQRGICKVRFNEAGVLRVPFNYAAGVHNDPIEKKPFFHVLPGSSAMSFGMLGCDFHCSYCQNWFTSQALRDDASTLNFSSITAAEICDLAEQRGSKSVISTYNEPLITSEWAVEVFRAAKERGLRTGYVSNGHGTPEVLEYLQPWLDLFKIDLKSFSAKNYRRLGGNLDAVLETIRQVHAMGFWTEIVTLVVPDYNDSDEELTQMAEFIAGVSVDIPWHVTGFYPTYKMTDRESTPAATLLRARQRGIEAGLKFVYSGNRTGQVENTESTFCPKCSEVVIERWGFQVVANRLVSGDCPKCLEPIPGKW